MRTRKQRWAILGLLLGLACLVQAATICRASLVALDAAHFVSLAQSLEREGSLPPNEHQQPLFPAWLRLVHATLERTFGPWPSIWATSAQLAAAIPLVLLMAPLYFLLVRLVGDGPAAAATALFAVLPAAARLGAEGISDSTHLLFFCAALWGLGEYFGRRKGEGEGADDCKLNEVDCKLKIADCKLQIEETSPLAPRPSPFAPRPSPLASPPTAYRLPPTAFLLLAGLATGLAVLTRGEALVLAIAVVGSLLGFQLAASRRQAWQHVLIAIACYLVGLSVFLIAPPHVLTLAFRGPATPPVKPQAAWKLPSGEEASFSVKEPTRASSRQRGYAAATKRFTTRLASAFGFVAGPLALLGLWRLRRRVPGDADRFLQVFFVLFAMVVLRFTAVEGYLEARHVLPLLVVGIGAAGVGACALRPAWLAPAVVLLAVAIGIAQLLSQVHGNAIGHRQAADWLAAQHDGGAVLDTRGWTGLYSGHRTYGYQDAPAALADPHLTYIVLEQEELEFDSARARTLRWLVDRAGQRVGEYPPPAARTAHQQPVFVYRWNAARL